MLWPCLIAFSDHFLKSPRQARNTTQNEENASGGNKKQHFRDREAAPVNDRLPTLAALAWVGRSPFFERSPSQAKFGGNNFELLALPAP